MLPTDFPIIVAKKYIPVGEQKFSYSSILSLKYILVYFAFIVVIGLSWFLFTAKVLLLDIEPAESKIQLDTALFIRFSGNRLLIRPGEYRISLEHQGYIPFKNEPLVVFEQQYQSQFFILTKLPGVITFTSEPQDVKVFLGNTLLGNTPFSEDIAHGNKDFLFTLQNYKSESRTVTVTGMGQAQKISIQLQPDWADFTINTAPSEVEIWLKDTKLGLSPGRFRIPSGEQTLVFKKRGYKLTTRTVKAVTFENTDLLKVVLEKADSRVLISSLPEGANILIDNKFYGQTPATIALSPGKKYKVFLSKLNFSEYKTTIDVASGVKNELQAVLKPQNGTVVIGLNIEDAKVLLNSKPLKFPNRELTLLLPSVAQVITATHPNYANWQQRFTPEPGITTRVDIRMQTQRQHNLAMLGSETSTFAGQKMLLIRQVPLKFKVGSARNDLGYQSNQRARLVRLEEPFYISATEVSNKEFRQFRNDHSSGAYKQIDLDVDNHPVVNVSWVAAAAYCNWLSAMDEYTPVYILARDVVSGINQNANGYRLPTEIEWALVARQPSKDGSLNFPWGYKMPPKPRSGNYADESAEEFLPQVMRNYRDGFSGTSPVGKFPANSLGVHDLGGNVAEWMQDVYSINPNKPSRVNDFLLSAPRVIRGSSWQTSTLRKLRLAYRSYGYAGQPDVGFRIVRTPKL